MPRNIDATFKEQKNKEENQPIFLYIIHLYDGTNDLKLAEYNHDIIFAGVTYASFPLNHEVIGENTQGELSTVKVRLSNVSRLIQSYLEEYDLRKKKVTIKMVWRDKLDDGDAYIEDVYYIDGYTVDQNNAEFTLTSKFDIMDVELPFRKYSRNYCGWKFKGTECGYAGVEATCNKTLTRCRTLTNQLRFGGFPSVPSKRIFGSW